MKKLSLELENLRVESFTTSEESEAQKGTVHGQMMAPDTKSVYWSCVCTPSDQYTCAC